MDSFQDPFVFVIQFGVCLQLIYWLFKEWIKRTLCYSRYLDLEISTRLTSLRQAAAEEVNKKCVKDHPTNITTESEGNMASKIKDIDLSFIPQINLSFVLSKMDSSGNEDTAKDANQVKTQKKPKLKQRLKMKSFTRRSSCDSYPVLIAESTSTQRRRNSTTDCSSKNKATAEPTANLKNRRHYKKLWENIDRVSKQSKSKPKSNPKSLKVFNTIASVYEIQQACKDCYDGNIYNDHTHQCNAVILLVRQRKSGGKWILIRNVPKDHKFENELCESIISTSDCPQKTKCTFPHSQDEKVIWNIFLKENWGIGAMLSDFKSSDLQLRYVMEKIHKQIKLLLVCKTCYRKKNYNTFLKAKRKPHCMNDHNWETENQLLVLELSSDEKEGKIYEEITESRDISVLDISDSEKKCASMVKDLITNGVNLVDILKAHIDARRRVYKKQTRLGESFHPVLSTYNVECVDDCNDEFDTYFEDVLTNEDIDLSEIEDSYKRDYLEKKSQHELYYDLYPHEELKTLLEEDPDKYKLCTIKLDGSQKATCTTIEEEEEKDIEIRGRHNCGPTGNGDLVVVKIQKEEVLDAEWKKTEIKDGNDTELEVIRGVVVGVMQQNINRQIYNFVCTVDEYYSHLMIPHCGTIPKIHVEDDPIKKLPDEMKNRRVCIYRKDGTKLEHIRTVSVNPKNKQDKLFLVRYEKWGPTHIYPYGYVVKVLEPGIDIISGQRLLDLMYQVPPEYSDDINKKVKLNYRFGIPKKMFENREDCTNLNILSIDPPGCEDVDDALSIRDLGKKTKDGEAVFEVGVHISDVTVFVKKDDEVDKIAAIRKTSYYPATGSPTHMLPHVLSRDLCSLREKEKRLALSLFFHITKQGQILGKPKFVETIILNRKQLTYSEAEEMIAIPNWLSNDEVAGDVRLLHKLAKGLKHSRLERGCIYRELEKLYEDYENAPQAHMLIEEFMIQANTFAAEYLVQKLPDRAIVRSQKPPNDDEYNEWQETNNEILQTSSFFQPFIKNEKSELSASFRILNSSYGSLSQASIKENIQEIIDIITTEKMHPSMTVVFSEWLNMQHRAKVHKHHGKGNHHFSLQKSEYTWFTSPIRRYMDIVVHRLIKSTIQKNYIHTDAYTPLEIENFCTGFNTATYRAKKYSRCCHLLSTACGLKESPICAPGVIVNYNDDGMEFEFPYLEHMVTRKRSINYSLFSVCDKPEETPESMRIYWQRRIYDTQPQLQYMRSKQMTKPDFISKLNHQMHTREVTFYNWQEICELIQSGQHNDIPAATARLIDASDQRNLQNGYRDDVTSEMKGDLPIIKHQSRFSMDIAKGFVFQLHLGASMPKGILEPSIHLMSLSKSLDICIEHADDPVKCFADIATKSCKQRYRDVQEYQETWQPILAMEAACNAVQQSDPIIIHHVPVTMQVNNGKYFGHFELHKDFCGHRHVNFISNSKEEEEESLDYLCMRCPLSASSLMLPQSAGVSTIAQHFEWRNMWCAHAIAKNSSLTKDEKIRVEFEVNQYNSSPPQEVLIGRDKLYTVEFLVRTIPDRRMDDAVCNLESATDFCKKVVLGHSIQDDDNTCEVPENLDISVQKAVNYRSERLRLPLNNDSQDLAIRTALKKKFTIIQGPPGTGKTLTGVKLVYWFTEFNKKSAGKRQVMYCGPSNSAVDVATNQLRSRLAEKCPKIVRVYSSMLEKQVFPIPRDYYGITYAKGRKYQLIFKEEQQEYALHHLIRKPSNPYSRKILSYDKLFKTRKPEDIADFEIKKYEKLITDAAVHELPKYDVILCTCTVASCPRISRSTNIYQCIIDESGMCMEPQTLVPLVSMKPEQVVLIGDHRQLQPIVINQTAKDLGLEVSMFERQTNNYGAIMLDKQYRMHKAICEFPSQHFYEGKLETLATRLTTKIPMYIWPNRQSPIVFCHVEGEEKSLSVSTDDGNEQSKSNEAEIQHAIRIFLKFVNDYFVHYQSITILSQYKAQCKLIEKRLVDMGYDKPNVSTVVASQGDEWDYVILTTVRSMPRYEIDKRPSRGWLKRNLGFIIDDHQINVAITRARKGLIIIGNKHILQCDNDPRDGFWGKLLHFYGHRNCIVNAKLFPARPDENQKMEELRNDALKMAESEVKDLEFEDRFKELPPRFRKKYMQQAAMFQKQ